MKRSKLTEMILKDLAITLKKEWVKYMQRIIYAHKSGLP